MITKDEVTMGFYVDLIVLAIRMWEAKQTDTHPHTFLKHLISSSQLNSYEAQNAYQAAFIGLTMEGGLPNGG